MTEQESGDRGVRDAAVPAKPAMLLVGMTLCAAVAFGAGERWEPPVGFTEVLSAPWTEPAGQDQPLERTLSWEGLGEEERFSLFFSGVSFSSHENGTKSRRRPEGSAISAAVGIELTEDWRVAARLAAAQGEDATGGGSALEVTLTGKVGGIALEAGFEESRDAFFVPGQRRESAGSKGHLKLRRGRKGWRLQGHLAVKEAPSGKEKTLTALDSRVRLPGGVRTQLALERERVGGGRDTVESVLRLDKKWERWQLSLKDRQRKRDKRGTNSVSSVDSLAASVRFRPSPRWTIAGGTQVEERARPHARDESRTLFLAPSWTASNEALELKLKLHYGTDEKRGGSRSEGFRGRGSLEWQARCKSCQAFLAFDFTWSELGDPVHRRHGDDRRANLSLKLGFPASVGGG